MPTRKKNVVADIALNLDGPTVVPLDKLYTWVVWQFPKPREAGYGGAVHPPDVGHGWYPAVVNAEAGEVTIYGHVKERFANPETASKSLDKA